MLRRYTTAAALLVLACMLSGCGNPPTPKPPTPEEKDEAPEVTGLEPDFIDSEFWDSANLQLRITRTGHGFVGNQEWTETTDVAILLDEEGSWEFTGVGWGMVEMSGELGGVPVSAVHETECVVMGEVVPNRCELKFLLIKDEWLEGEGCATAPVIGTQCGPADGDNWCWIDADYFAQTEAAQTCHLGSWVVPLWEPLEFEAVRAGHSHWTDTFEVIGITLDDLPERCSDIIVTYIEEED